ncbi:Rid family detoxifying hydrolase [Blattabacterium cuenoti]|uniref:Rid family detoxifying hydrolase n=1 Tax=Blattabacterium cuenoti TaxID=1653831 RepID=UPI00293BCFA3|nr:Rid family detoxifying hydrolase [Blattabacterium cuenoti]
MINNKKILSKQIPSYGPYSTCVFANNFIFISGQIGIDIKTGNLVTDSIEDETKEVMKNIQIILIENGLSFRNIIKSSIFVKKFDSITKINEVYSSFFEKKNFPSRETIQVVGLPKNANIEISSIAYKY